MRRYLKRNLSYGEFKKPKIRWTTLIITKVFISQFGCFPMVLGISWWQVLIGFFSNALHSWS
jgi:linoleoyl-CoA desaturase